VAQVLYTEPSRHLTTCWFLAFRFSLLVSPYGTRRIMTSLSEHRDNSIFRKARKRWSTSTWLPSKCEGGTPKTFFKVVPSESEISGWVPVLYKLDASFITSKTNFLEKGLFFYCRRFWTLTFSLLVTEKQRPLYDISKRVEKRRNGKPISGLIKNHAMNTYMGVEVWLYHS
jgi:hypothetical protein